MPQKGDCQISGIVISQFRRKSRRELAIELADVAAKLELIGGAVTASSIKRYENDDTASVRWQTALLFCVTLGVPPSQLIIGSSLSGDGDAMNLPELEMLFRGHRDFLAGIGKRWILDRPLEQVMELSLRQQIALSNLEAVADMSLEELAVSRGSMAPIWSETFREKSQSLVAIRFARQYSRLLLRMGDSRAIEPAGYAAQIAWAKSRSNPVLTVEANHSLTECLQETWHSATAARELAKVEVLFDLPEIKDRPSIIARHYSVKAANLLRCGLIQGAHQAAMIAVRMRKSGPQVPGDHGPGLDFLQGAHTSAAVGDARGANELAAEAFSARREVDPDFSGPASSIFYLVESDVHLAGGSAQSVRSAVRSIEIALEKSASEVPVDHPRHIRIMIKKGETLARAGRTAQAEQMLQDASELLEGKPALGNLLERCSTAFLRVRGMT